MVDALCAIQTGRSVGSLRRRRARYCLAATLFISPGLVTCGGSATAPTDNILDCTGSACIAVASFEADFDGWVPRTADAGPFLIERTMRRARDRQWSVELYAINSTAATHLWLQRAVRVAPNRRYDVRLEYALCCISYASGSTNQFQLIADASTSPKPSVAPAFSYSPPDTHEDSSADAGLGALRWRHKRFDLTASSGADGRLFISAGVVLGFEVPFTFQLDAVRLTVTPSSN